MGTVIRTQVEGLTPAVPQNSQLDIGEFSFMSFAGQNSILFPTGKTYAPDTNSVFVFVDGKMLPKTKYTETSPDIIMLNFVLDFGIEVTVKWFNYIDTTQNNPAVLVSYTEPTNKYNGMIWFNPDWAGSIFIYNEMIQQFQEIAFKRDIVAAGMGTLIQGGGF